MKQFRILPGALALIALSATPAWADDLDNAVLNGQLNLKDVISEQNVYVYDTGELNQSANARGNQLSVDLKGASYIETSQVSHANVEAAVNLEAGWIEGVATTNSTSVTNAAEVTGDGSGDMQIANYQEANPHCESCYDDAMTYISAEGVGVLDSSTVAIANSFNASNGTGGMNAHSYQVNNSKMSATSNIFVGYAGSLNASSMAVGNSASFSN